MKQTILIVDDEKDTRDLMARALSLDYQVTTAPDAEQAMLALASNPTIALMLSDVRMPGASGLELLKAAKAKYPKLLCILLTAFGTVDQAVAAMKDGAEDFIMKPVDLDQLELRVAKALKTGALEHEVAELRSQLDEKFGLENMIGSSPAMVRVFNLVRRAAPTTATVLLQGPNGTGKDLVAHSLHNLSPRAKGPFIAINCGAIPENLIESELFGHEKGSFSGAIERHIGSFEAANHGTIFLDEIGELPLPLQVKLLRVLENRSFTRVGGTELINVDIRVVAATNRDLKALVAQGSFREDLFYRLNVVDIYLPALKDRTGDIPLLVSRFIKELAEKNGVPEPSITPAALRLLEQYAWPGNVRELRNVIERMVVLALNGTLDVDDVPDSIRTFSESAPLSATVTLGENEKTQILAVLKECGGNRSEAARKLGISRRTIYRKLDEYAKEGTSI
ncbi:MAG: sigma-54 dependent transcriptional regulator [Kiritimatiellae bacterium]|nr:sigma-54 dependent transcriptional regulator [Kiritimatiellia bacterium]